MGIKKFSIHTILFLILLIFSANVCLCEYKDSLVSYWKFDDGNGMAANDSAGDNDGILGNMDENAWVQGKIGYALQFDGVDDYVDCGNDSSFDITDEITINAWFYYEGYTVFPRLVTKGHNTAWSVFFDFDDGVDTIFFMVNHDATGRRTVDIEKNQWLHFSVVYESNPEGNEVSYYLNGGLVANFEGLEDISSDPDMNVSIGNEFGNSRPYTGMIDEVAIWNKALSSTEVLDIYNLGVEAVARIPEASSYILILLGILPLIYFSCRK